MSDADFLQAILIDPGDDTIRLQYADWLEERGDPRGEFIRVQCALARTPEYIDIGPVTLTKGPMRGKATMKMRNHEFVALRAREQELLAGHGWGWAGDAVRACYLVGTDWRDVLIFRRGFVAQVTLPTQAFLDHAAALFRAAPITEVTLTDREPDHEEDNLWRWYTGYESPDAIPLVLAKPMMPAILATIGASSLGNEAIFADREDALAALSRACVAYGRRLANLPPLRVADG